MRYEFDRIEPKWQRRWEEEKTFEVKNDDPGEKFYALVEFPYPSGHGLHVGHARPYTAMDVVTRKRRMEGQKVLFPIGWDAFGLPTENFAIANKIHPTKVTKDNIQVFKTQLKQLGYGFDWGREIDTTDPAYVKWTQWIFLQFYKKGLAYKEKMPVNWCTSCKIVLANEEVVDNGCERCGGPVVRKEKSQWMLKITAYAQRLLDDLEEVDFIERVKLQQRNWIGRSTGAEVDFQTTAGDPLRVFTTRPDTLFGATYMVMAPEHAYLSAWADRLKNRAQVEEYCIQAGRKSDFERTELTKDKTGVRLDGVSAINPATGDEVPIFISDYVLATYGTGAIMAVPGHDQRDWEFAKKFGLPIIEVVAGGNIEEGAYADTEKGKLVNSGFLNGLEVDEAKKRMVKWLEDRNLGEATVNYKLRDWVFSRQRYWGEPIPIVICDTCGYVPLRDDQLPLVLPDVASYEPTDTGESPLAKVEDWVKTTCPKCGKPAMRETDTMPNWAGSSWYFLRYADPHCDTAPASKKALDTWMPVDWYNGGMEHTTLHLLYSRFWHKFLYDLGIVSTKEPYMKRTSHGMILGEGGEKMSKSRGNVVNPTDIIRQYGADTMRMYIMFIGDFEKAAPWSSTAVKGCKRFLDRVWNLSESVRPENGYTEATARTVHRTIKKVTGDIEAMKFNTAIAALMSLVNEFSSTGVTRGDMKTLLLLLSPFAPHMAEEIWERLGFGGMACRAPWPAWEESMLAEDRVQMAIQIGGKLRGTVEVPADSDEATVLEAAKGIEKVSRQMEGMEIVKTILVKNKLLNLILKPQDN